MSHLFIHISSCPISHARGPRRSSGCRPSQFASQPSALEYTLRQVCTTEPIPFSLEINQPSSARPCHFQTPHIVSPIIPACIFFSLPASPLSPQPSIHHNASLAHISAWHSVVRLLSRPDVPHNPACTASRVHLSRLNIHCAMDTEHPYVLRIRSCPFRRIKVIDRRG